MGDGEKASLRLQFNPKIRLEFHGSTITTDAGLLAFREFDDALGLTEIAEDYLQESRTGRNILHHLVPLLRQSIYSRLAGYDDTNDAVRLSQDPVMRVIVGWQGSERKGASTSEMGRFETEFLTQEDNRQALARMNTQWVERAMAHTLHQRVILDMDSPDLYPSFLRWAMGNCQWCFLPFGVSQLSSFCSFNSLKYRQCLQTWSGQGDPCPGGVSLQGASG